MMKKRLISLLLTAFMLFSTLSIPASAAEDIPAGEAYFDFEASEYQYRTDSHHADRSA